MRNIKLILEYDGTRYHGFQRQAPEKEPTIQGILEASLARLLGRPVSITGAGRTDAGVHARGQVINFHWEEGGIPTARIPLALNGILPEDIRVLSAEEAPEDFHARYSASGKVYAYLLLLGERPSVFFRHYSWWVGPALDLAAMQAAASRLVGRHDFSSFRAAGCAARSPVRTLTSLDCRLESWREARFCRVTAAADGFLYKMVRNLVATLVAVGKGELTPEEVAAILAARDRNLVPPTAPPQGLTLMKVKYDKGTTTVKTKCPLSGRQGGGSSSQKQLDDQGTQTSDNT